MIGDSMLEGLDERKMSSKCVAKVRKFPWATTDDIYHYIMPLLRKQPENVNLHIGTNDASSCNSSEIVNNLLVLKLRSFISQKLPNVIYYFIETDNEIRYSSWKGYYWAWSYTPCIEEVNKQLNDFDFDIIDNSNLSRAHLNGGGLHLNTKCMYVTVCKKSDWRFLEIVK